MTTYYHAISGARIANASRVDQSGSDDAPVIDWPKANHFILACHFYNELSGKNPSSSNITVEWRNKTQSGSWTQLSGTGELTWTATTDLVNDTALLPASWICSVYDAGYTNTDGIEREGANLYALDLGPDDESEVQWAINGSGGGDGDEYEFRIYDALRTAYMTVVPTITMEVPSSSSSLSSSSESSLSSSSESSFSSSSESSLSSSSESSLSSSSESSLSSSSSSSSESSESSSSESSDSSSSESSLSSSSESSWSAPCVATDYFNRSNNDDLGSNWTEDAGDLDIESNQLQTRTGGYGRDQAHWNAHSFQPDQYAKVKINGAVSNTYPAIMFRYTNSTSPYYWVQFGDSTIYFEQEDQVGGPSHEIQTVSNTRADGDVYGVTVVGAGSSTIVRIWKNPTNNSPAAYDGWDSAGDTADYTLTDDPGQYNVDSGPYIALCNFQSTAGVISFDDFCAGDFDISASSSSQSSSSESSLSSSSESSLSSSSESSLSSSSESSFSSSSESSPESQSSSSSSSESSLSSSSESSLSSSSESSLSSSSESSLSSSSESSLSSSSESSLSSSSESSLSSSSESSLSSSSESSLSSSSESSLSSSSESSLSSSSEESASSSSSAEKGEICWGHDTDVLEINVKDFQGRWTGTGTIEGSGDNEVIRLKPGQYMESESWYFGNIDCAIQRDFYQSGSGSVTIEYRTGATRAVCDAAGWTAYSEPFSSSNWVGVRLEA